MKNTNHYTTQLGLRPLLLAWLLFTLLVVGCNNPFTEGSANAAESPDTEVEEPVIVPEPVPTPIPEPEVILIKPGFMERVDRQLGILSATRRYDAHFKHYSGRFLPTVDWRFLKALCWVESHLRPEVRSPVGAMGLCQFMPATFEQYKNAFNMPHANPNNPEHSIKFAAAHMQYLINFWSSPRPDEDRLKLGTASYNAGQGNLLRAQRLCVERNGVAVLYDDIIICLVDITGVSNSTETINHVIRIWHAWHAMVITGH